MNPNHSDRKHSKVSPSKLKTLEVSPKWAPLENQEVHPITAVGTKIHEALDANKPDNLTDEEREYFNRCKERLLQWHDAGFRISFNELKLEMPPFTIWGFADKVMVDDAQKPTVAILIDYKFSTQLQEAVETNPAAQAYAYGIFKKWPRVTTVAVDYIYPRLGVIDSGKYLRKDMARIQARITAIIKRVEDPNIPCQIAEDACVYCRHAATCAVVATNAMPIAKRYAERKEFLLPEELDAALVTDPTKMATLLKYADVMGQWAESVKVHAKELRMNMGVEIPGYQLVPRKGSLSVQDVNAAYKMATEKFGVSHNEFLAATKVSVTDVMEAVRRNAPDRAKGKAESAFRDALQDSGAATMGQDSWVLQKEKKKG